MKVLFIKTSVLFFLTSFLFGCYSIPIGVYKPITSDGDTLLFYLAQKDYKSKNKNDKLLVLIQGSGRQSISSRFGWSAKGIDMGYDVLFMEKYAFDDSIKFEMTNYRERRINDINFILNYINNSIYKNNLKDVVIFADSEGGDIAPEIACENNFVKKLIIIGNGGMSGPEKIKILFEKEKKLKYQGYLTMSGIKSTEQIDSLLNDIKNNPTTERRFLGSTYKYWNSYIFYDVDSFYDKLTIPTLVIIGDKDMSVPCESVSFLKEKYKNNRNFSCYIIPGLNHNLLDSDGNKHFNDVLKDYVLPWLDKNSK
jgi:pimeloyl-ACP methyl ester carboxylesterase